MLQVIHLARWVTPWGSRRDVLCVTPILHDLTDRGRRLTVDQVESQLGAP